MSNPNCRLRLRSKARVSDMLSSRNSCRTWDPNLLIATLLKAFTATRASKFRMPSECFQCPQSRGCQLPFLSRWAGTSWKLGSSCHPLSCKYCSAEILPALQEPVMSSFTKPAAVSEDSLAEWVSQRLKRLRSLTRPTLLTPSGFQKAVQTPKPVLEASLQQTRLFQGRHQSDLKRSSCSPANAESSCRTDSQRGMLVK